MKIRFSTSRTQVLTEFFSNTFGKKQRNGIENTMPFQRKHYCCFIKDYTFPPFYASAVPALGFGPKALSSVPAMHRRTSSQIDPTRGIRAIKIQVPFLPISCNLRHNTAKEGIKTARIYKPRRIPAFSFRIRLPRIARTIIAKQLNNVNIQYSLRLALPLKSAYCFQHFKYHCIKNPPFFS